jgi:signal transduction histidine kinase
MGPRKALNMVFTGNLSMLEAKACHQETAKHLQPMKSAADKMSRLTRQLLAYARGGQYSLETMLPGDLVRSSMPLLNSVFKPSIIVETELPSSLPPIRIDKDQMHMALHAILSNASEAIATHGVIRSVSS